MAKNPMGNIKKAMGIKDEGSDEQAGTEETQAAEQPQQDEESVEEQPQQQSPRQTRESQPRQASQIRQKAADPIKEVKADDVLNLTRGLPLIPIHYFTVIPIQDDEHKILVGWTLENVPVLKIQASGKAIDGLYAVFVNLKQREKA